MNRRKIFRWVKVIVLLYAGIGIALYYLQDKFLLHPKVLAAEYQFQFKQPFRELNIPINKKENLSLVKFFPRDSMRRGVVLYFHGNRDNINHYAGFSEMFTNNGYEVWMADYPGFGKTTGRLTEAKLYEQALIIHGLALANFSEDSIVVYGRSFGTGIATNLASVSNNKLLILETPYYSIPSLFKNYAPIYPTERMSNFKIPLNEFIEDVDCPISIFHGTDDEVIPYRNAARLKEKLKKGDEFITINNGKHNDLSGFDVFKQKLDSLLLR